MTVLTEQLAPAAASDNGPGPDTGRLVMSCVDGPGIIARVTGFLHRRGANIVQSDQYSTGPTGGQFFLRTEFRAQFRLRDASVPARVAVFVSRQDHCLLDLLWRERRGELPVHMQILSPAFLEQVGVPVINIHHSFLPAFAGAAPYERARRSAEIERTVLVRAVTWHCQDRVLLDGRTAIVF